MAWGKYKHLNKIQAIHIQTASNHLPAVLLAELREVVCVNDMFLQSAGFYHSRLQPTLRDPPLHFLHSYVQRLGKCVRREPFTSHLRIRIEKVQHAANGAC